MSNKVKNLPDLTRRARNNLNPADLPVTRLVNPIVYVALYFFFFSFFVSYCIFTIVDAIELSYNTFGWGNMKRIGYEQIEQ
jgi:hypothetical protein